MGDGRRAVGSGPRAPRCKNSLRSIGGTREPGMDRAGQYYQPSDDTEIQQSYPDTLGIRHMAIEVEDIEGIVTTLKQKGTETFSEIQQYEQSYKLCYVRGPEGIILELAEKVK